MMATLSTVLGHVTKKLQNVADSCGIEVKSPCEEPTSCKMKEAQKCISDLKIKLSGGKYEKSDMCR